MGEAMGARLRFEDMVLSEELGARSVTELFVTSRQGNDQPAMAVDVLDSRDAVPDDLTAHRTGLAEAVLQPWPGLGVGLFMIDSNHLDDRLAARFCQLSESHPTMRVRDT
jgi:hypothetical protein